MCSSSARPAVNNTRARVAFQLPAEGGGDAQRFVAGRPAAAQARVGAAELPAHVQMAHAQTGEQGQPLLVFTLQEQLALSVLHAH